MPAQTQAKTRSDKSTSVRSRRLKTDKAEKPKRQRISNKTKDRIKMLAANGIEPEAIADVMGITTNTVVAALQAIKMGRPKAVITQSDIGQIEALSGLGLSKEKIAWVIGMSPKTLKAREDEEGGEIITEALERGQAKLHGKVAKSIVDLALAGNVSAAIWYEKTRVGYSDRVIIEKKVKREITDFFEFFAAAVQELKGQEIDEDTFEIILERYDSEFCSEESFEEETTPEVYR